MGLGGESTDEFTKSNTEKLDALLLLLRLGISWFSEEAEISSSEQPSGKDLKTIYKVINRNRYPIIPENNEHFTLI